MRQISEQLKSLLKHNNISDLRHRLLLYRRKWNIVASEYIIESIPIDITDSINHKGTNVSITHQLDKDAANVWKVGNLSLTLYNENNRFWQDKEDGLFPQPYIIYGSKLEYYIGSPTLNDYVKCFTGYLTELPNYRQDDGLVEIRALNRLDWLKTISAENASTKTTEGPLHPDGKTIITVNAAVGRVQKVLKEISTSKFVELIEKIDYTVSQLNDYTNGAIIELKSSLLPSEYIWITYIYWKKGIMIDELVNDLLTIAGIDDTYRIVEPIVFQNTARIFQTNIFNNSKVKWHYTNNANSLYINSDSASKSSYLSMTCGYNEGSQEWKYMNATTEGAGTYSFNLSFQLFNGSVRDDGFAGFINNKTNSGYGIRHLIAGFRFVRMNADGSYSDLSQVVYLGEHSLNEYPKSYITFSISPSGEIRFWFGGDLVWIGIDNTFNHFNFIALRNSRNHYDTMSNIKYSESVMTNYSQYSSIFSGVLVYSYPKIRFNFTNNKINFIAFYSFAATISTTGVPIPKIWIRHRNNSSSQWSDWAVIMPMQILNIGDRLLDIVITSGADKGNEYLLSESRISYLGIQDIPLSVCNLTNMSVLDALQELASLAMYEIGFDADDRFFFRKRQQTTQYKTITDDEIISMSGAKYDINRLKTRVVVGYGSYTKIVDSEQQEEIPPTNKDKYGERTYELSGSQLLPADNVDLAYAIAPTIYEELSKLRLTLSIDIILDLELELGDYVRILHNNNLFSKINFTDFTKWKETGTFYMKCKVAGIKTDFNKRITTLDLIDYTSPLDIPVEKGKEFAYQPQEPFDIKK
jgi:hypothetical protein